MALKLLTLPFLLLLCSAFAPHSDFYMFTLISLLLLKPTPADNVARPLDTSRNKKKISGFLNVGRITRASWF